MHHKPPPLYTKALAIARLLEGIPEGASDDHHHLHGLGTQQWTTIVANGGPFVPSLMDIYGQYGFRPSHTLYYSCECIPRRSGIGREG